MQPLALMLEEAGDDLLAFLGDLGHCFGQFRGIGYSVLGRIAFRRLLSGHVVIHENYFMWQFLRLRMGQGRAGILPTAIYAALQHKHCIALKP
jgi:hypothetical protein